MSVPVHRHRWARLAYHDELNRCDYVGCDAVEGQVGSVLAIDPGTRESAWLLLEGGQPVDFGILPNPELVAGLRAGFASADAVVIESVESYGMPVGREVFDTVRWTGRFEEAVSPRPVVLLPRRAVKLAICNSPKANDASIRQALLDRFGGSDARGTKHHPGPLYGIARDVWSALALAVTYQEAAR